MRARTGAEASPWLPSRLEGLAPHLDHDVQVSAYRPRRTGPVARDLLGVAPSSPLRLVALPARTRIHRRHEPEPRRQRGGGIRPAQRHGPVLQRLAQPLEHGPGELGQFIQEQNSAVRHRHLARANRLAATEHAHRRRGVVRCAKRAGRFCVRAPAAGPAGASRASSCRTRAEPSSGGCGPRPRQSPAPGVRRFAPARREDPDRMRFSSSCPSSPPAESGESSHFRLLHARPSAVPLRRPSAPIRATARSGCFHCSVSSAPRPADSSVSHRARCSSSTCFCAPATASSIFTRHGSGRIAIMLAPRWSYCHRHLHEPLAHVDLHERVGCDLAVPNSNSFASIGLTCGATTAQPASSSARAPSPPAASPGTGRPPSQRRPTSGCGLPSRFRPRRRRLTSTVATHTDTRPAVPVPWRPLNHEGPAAAGLDVDADG